MKLLRTTSFNKIIRQPAVLETLGISKSTLFNRINAGLFPPSINLGGRATGWLETEAQAVLSALMANQSQEEIKELVKTLLQARKGKGDSIHG